MSVPITTLYIKKNYTLYFCKTVRLSTKIDLRMNKKKEKMFGANFEVTWKKFCCNIKKVILFQYKKTIQLAFFVLREF